MKSGETEPNSGSKQESLLSRRDAIKGFAKAAVGAAAVGTVSTSQAADQQPPDPCEPKNPYGPKPGGGISLPPYYKPTPSVLSRNNYFPGVETIGADEMRISFVGSCPFPPRRSQAGTCIMVELGNGDRFFFASGPGMGGPTS